MFSHYLAHFWYSLFGSFSAFSAISFSHVPIVPMSGPLSNLGWLLVWLERKFLETNELRQANLCLRAFRHNKFQLRMSSHSEGPGIWFSVWRFLLIHCLYERAAEVLARLRLAWTFVARIGDKYQIRLMRSKLSFWFFCHRVLVLSHWFRIVIYYSNL